MANTKRKLEDSRPNPRPSPSGSLSHKKAKLLESRKSLPIFSEASKIRGSLLDHDVLVLSGETGSGKSTQVPQFILESAWCSGKIAVTQPRRVAAISLARRVADEMGTTLGSSSPASKVGYSVRFDDNTSPGTRIKFLTEGMLLQEMLRDESMKQYSCIIVDEVHERSVNVDMILGFLKGIVQRKTKRKTPLKVIVMSATADIETISAFFSKPEPSSPSREVMDTPLNDKIASRTGLSDGEDEKRIVAQCDVEGRQFPVKVHYLSKPTDNWIDTALRRIFEIHCKEPMPGDILVFLTGQETIQSLQKLVEEFAQNLTREFPKILVLPLYAALPQAAQQRIFETAPPNTRKVILSTNIAETSVTVPGVRFVVDSGLAKVRQFRNRLGLDSLLVKSISKSSADQRKGRAGREAAGQCHRLYTEQSFNELEKNTKPEILQCDLSSAILTMSASNIQNVFGFPFLTPPSRETMAKALQQLLELGCLREDGKISEIGRKIARLPLTPALGRVVLEAARPDKDCILEVIDIVACLSVDNTIFLHVETEDEREKAHEARSQLIRRQGDHLTLLTTVRAYADEQTDRKRWAAKHQVNHRAMQNVMDVRKQLIAQCKGLSTESPTVRTTVDEPTQEAILKCFLWGYRNNIARLCPDKTYKTFTGNGSQTVAIHPSSFLFGRKVEAIMYDEFVFTNKAYARNVSAIQLAWVDEIEDATS